MKTMQPKPPQTFGARTATEYKQHRNEINKSIVQNITRSVPYCVIILELHKRLHFLFLATVGQKCFL